MNFNKYNMKNNEKLFAIIGKLGKYKAAESLGMTYPTLLSRLKNPLDWKLYELDIIDKVHDDLFPIPNY